jgi:hypothetical protein
MAERFPKKAKPSFLISCFGRFDEVVVGWCGRDLAVARLRNRIPDGNAKAGRIPLLLSGYLKSHA